MSLVGYLGEGEGSHLLTEQTRVALINVYLDNFKKTYLIFQPLNGDAPDAGILVKYTNIAAYWPDGNNNGTGPQMRDLGWRLDCLGDIVHDEIIYIPHDMPTGTYQLEIAIVSPVSYEPRVKLAIAGVNEDGWYPMGEILVLNNN